MNGPRVGLGWSWYGARLDLPRMALSMVRTLPGRRGSTVNAPFDRDEGLGAFVPPLGLRIGSARGPRLEGAGGLQLLRAPPSGPSRSLAGATPSHECGEPTEDEIWNDHREFSPAEVKKSGENHHHDEASGRRDGQPRADAKRGGKDEP